MHEVTRVRVSRGSLFEAIKDSIVEMKLAQLGKLGRCQENSLKLYQVRKPSILRDV